MKTYLVVYALVLSVVCGMLATSAAAVEIPADMADCAMTCKRIVDTDGGDCFCEILC